MHVEIVCLWPAHSPKKINNWFCWRCDTRRKQQSTETGAHEQPIQGFFLDYHELRWPSLTDCWPTLWSILRLICSFHLRDVYGISVRWRCLSVDGNHAMHFAISDLIPSQIGGQHETWLTMPITSRNNSSNGHFIWIAKPSLPPQLYFASQIPWLTASIKVSSFTSKSSREKYRMFDKNSISTFTSTALWFVWRKLTADAQ